MNQYISKMFKKKKVFYISKNYLTAKHTAPQKILKMYLLQDPTLT